MKTLLLLIVLLASEPSQSRNIVDERGLYYQCLEEDKKVVVITEDSEIECQNVHLSETPSINILNLGDHLKEEVYKKSGRQ